MVQGHGSVIHVVASRKWTRFEVKDVVQVMGDY